MCRMENTNNRQRQNTRQRGSNGPSAGVGWSTLIYEAKLNEEIRLEP